MPQNLLYRPAMCDAGPVDTKMPAPKIMPVPIIATCSPSKPAAGAEVSRQATTSTAASTAALLACIPQRSVWSHTQLAAQATQGGTGRGGAQGEVPRS